MRTDLPLAWQATLGHALQDEHPFDRRKPLILIGFL